MRLLLNLQPCLTQSAVYEYNLQEHIEVSKFVKSNIRDFDVSWPSVLIQPFRLTRPIVVYHAETTRLDSRLPPLHVIRHTTLGSYWLRLGQRVSFFVLHNCRLILLLQT